MAEWNRYSLCASEKRDTRYIRLVSWWGDVLLFVAQVCEFDGSRLLPVFREEKLVSLEVGELACDRFVASIPTERTLSYR